MAAIDKIEGLAKKYNKALAGFAFPEMTTVWEDRIRRGYRVRIYSDTSYDSRLILLTDVAPNGRC